MRHLVRTLCFLLAVLATACGDPANTLTGSISELLALEFDSVRIRKQGDTLLIEYLEGEQSVICKVALDTSGLPLRDGAIINGDLFLQRVVIQRAAETSTEFPPVTGGQIKFERYQFQNGGTMDGEFDALFNNGRTLFGTFEETVREVSLQ